MVEFDKILEEMGRLSKRQWMQIMLMMIPGVLVAAQMGAMVYLGAEVGKRCEFPHENKLTEKCNRTWSEEQTKKYVPWDETENKPSVCERYNLPNMRFALDCSYWWGDNNGNKTYAKPGHIEVANSTEKCVSWIYNETSTFTSTVQQEFQLICSESYKVYLSQSIYMFGVTIGCVFWGQVSDRYGRKTAFIVSVIFGTGFAIAVAFSNSYTVFVILRSFSGSCLFSSFTTAYVLATEIVPPKHRVRVGETCQAFFALGFCLLALYGYLVREWRKLQLLLSVPILALISYYWLVFESPRWLISTKKYVEANAVVKMLLTNLGRKNDIQEVKFLEQKAKGTSPSICTDRKIDDDVDENRGYGPLDLIRTPNMRSKSLKLFYCWLVCSCVYYGLTLNSADLGGDPFVNLFLSGFVEIPAVVMCIPMLEKWGRRPSLSFTLILSGVACVTMMFVPKELLWLNITLSMIGKFAISAAFGAVYIYAAEIYPTPIRNVGIGVCSSSARVGGIISPFIAMSSLLAKPLPYVVFGIISIVGGILALFLPEVLGIRLPETMKEGEEFGLDQTSPVVVILEKICCCRNRRILTNDQPPGVQYSMVADNGKNTHEHKV